MDKETYDKAKEIKQKIEFLNKVKSDIGDKACIAV